MKLYGMKYVKEAKVEKANATVLPPLLIALVIALFVAPAVPVVTAPLVPVVTVATAPLIPVITVATAPVVSGPACLFGSTRYGTHCQY